MPASKALALESLSVCQAHSGHRCAAVPVLQRRPAACGADAGRAKATAHGQQHGAAAGTRPAMRGNGRIGGSAFTARSGGPGCAAGAASAKHLAVPARIAPVRALRSANCPPARLCRRSFGLPTARAPAHNLLGQQGLKISTPTIDRLAGASVQRGLSAAGGDR